MKKGTCFRTALIIFVFAISAIAAQATVLRAYVSSTGSDGNVGVNCAQATPCRTFAAAFPVVTAGGELIALDSSGYGGIPNINKSITIAAVPGAHAFIVVAGNTSGITVNVGVNDVVTLRNLHFNGSGSAVSFGVSFNTGNTLHIENCIFTGLAIGIYDVAMPSSMSVTDCTFRDLRDGIDLDSFNLTGFNKKAFVEHCHFENYYARGFATFGNGYGVATIRDSQFVGPSKDAGVGITAANPEGSSVMVENCLITNNYRAVSAANANNLISLSQDVIFYNGLGLETCCLAKIITFGNNRFLGNDNDGSFSAGVALK